MTTLNQSYEITSILWKPVVFIGLIAAILIAVVFFHYRQYQIGVFPKYVFGFSLIFLFLILAFVLTFNLTSRIYTTAQGIQIKTLFHNESIGFDQVMLEDLEIINISSAGSQKPKKRNFGISMPGLDYGWYTLGNGQRSFLVVTNSHDLIYLNTSLGHSYILSLNDPAKFVESIDNFLKHKK